MLIPAYILLIRRIENEVKATNHRPIGNAKIRDQLTNQRDCRHARSSLIVPSVQRWHSLRPGDDVSLTDPDDIIDRFVNQHRSEIPTPDSINIPRQRKAASVAKNFRERPPSVNTLDTEPWLRPGTEPAGAAGTTT